MEDDLNTDIGAHNPNLELLPRFEGHLEIVRLAGLRPNTHYRTFLELFNPKLVLSIDCHHRFLELLKSNLLSEREASLSDGVDPQKLVYKHIYVQLRALGPLTDPLGAELEEESLFYVNRELMRAKIVFFGVEIVL